MLNTPMPSAWSRCALPRRRIADCEVCVLTPSVPNLPLHRSASPRFAPQYGAFRKPFKNKDGQPYDKNDSRLVFYGIRYIVVNYLDRKWTKEDVRKAAAFYKRVPSPRMPSRALRCRLALSDSPPPGIRKSRGADPARRVRERPALTAVASRSESAARSQPLASGCKSP